MADNIPMSVAILDDYQNIASPIFSRLGSKIHVQSFPETLDTRNEQQRAALINRLKEFTVISTMRERTAFTSDVINGLPNLRLILTTGMANASIDLKACASQKVLVLGTSGKRIQTSQPPPGTKTLSPSLQSTVEQTWALILACAKLIPQNSNGLRAGKWQGGLSTSLSGETLGLVGLGRIGGMVGRVAVLGFGMKVLAWSESLTQVRADEKARELGLEAGCFRAAGSKAEVLREADVVSLHYVLSDRSRGMIGEQELAAMNNSAFLINTSRSGLTDEAALLRALKKGQIKGVGLDVFDTEPLPISSEWRTTQWGENGSGHAVLAPHMGYASEEVIRGWYEESFDNLEEWLEGRIPGTVLR